MKRYLSFLFIIIVLYPIVLLPGEVTLKKLGEWGSGDYIHVVLKDKYAYCAAFGGGLDIIDISNPAAPYKVGNCETPGIARRVYVRGNYAYVADRRGGLQIIDVSDPSKPVSVLPTDFVQVVKDARDVCGQGDYIYVADSSFGLRIIDVSNPSSPVLKSTFDSLQEAAAVYVKGNYVYAAYSSNDIVYSKNLIAYIRILDVSIPSSPVVVGEYFTKKYYFMENIVVDGNYAYVACSNVETSDFFSSLLVLDVSVPTSPTLVGEYTSSTNYSKYVTVNGNYAYLAEELGGVDIIDISNPASPSKTGEYKTNGTAYSAVAEGKYLYIAFGEKGLRVVEISTPSSPMFVGAYNHSGEIKGILVKGNYAYITKGIDSFNIIDISNPASPLIVGEYETPSQPNRLFIADRYAYVACDGYIPNDYYTSGSILVLDIYNPASPTAVANIYIHAPVVDICINGNYAYAACRHEGLQVIDISNLSAPEIVNTKFGWVSRVHLAGNHLYALGMDFSMMNILRVFDISDPASPTLSGYLSENEYKDFELPGDVLVKGDYAYIAGSSGFHIVDVSDPTSPSPSSYFSGAWVLGISVEGDHGYTATNEFGLSVINIANPTLPYLEGQYTESGDGNGVVVKAPYIYLAAGNSGKLVILEQSFSAQSPQVLLNRNVLKFGVSSGGIVSVPQSFIVDNAGGGTLHWSVSDNADWLHCSPVSGTGSGEVTVSVDPTGLSPFTYHAGTVTVSDPDAWNSPQTITVFLVVDYNSGPEDVPFGQFDTPVDGSTVRGSVPVTGWALDDIGVQSVQIFREEGESLVYIGDAVFVDGARPDAALLYSNFPNSYCAGWGYMMLTNFLPNGGNGTFTIHAVATDLEGNQVTLGTRTITCDNANAEKPFGAIDTPAQGGSASGSQFANYGWALTPLPNTIPIDGSTIGVWVDGVLIGNPVYNLYREDIATLFPGCNNSSGAVGYFNLDTTQFANGVHIIHWTVTDDAGNAEGIGSRYFRILNTPENRAQGTQGTVMSPPPNEFTVDTVEPMGIVKGYEIDAEPGKRYPDDSGSIIVEIRELDRLELHLPFAALVARHPGSLVVGDRLMPLPVGSTVDMARGVFSWQTGPGFVGKYKLRFFGKGLDSEMIAKDVIVQINPKFSDLILKRGTK
jgi:hypothetical protein